MRVFPGRQSDDDNVSDLDAYRVHLVCMDVILLYIKILCALAIYVNAPIYTTVTRARGQCDLDANKLVGPGDVNLGQD